MKLLTPGPNEPIAVIAKLAGDSCNINCYYCYEKRQPYGDGRDRLTPEVLRLFLAKCGTRPIRVVLHGGEPLVVGKRRMRELLEVLTDYPGPVALAMQTNGLLLDAGWLALFDEVAPAIDIAVSLDGPGTANSFRVDYRDRPTYDRVLRAITLLGESGRDVGIATTVTRLLLGREEELMELLASLPRVRAVRLSPCLDYSVVTRKFPKGNELSLRVLNGAGRGAAGWATAPGEFARFVARCFDLWRQSHYWQFLLEPTYSMLLSASGGDSALTDWSDRKEPFIVSLYPTGDVHSSDEISVPGNRLGSVYDPKSLSELLDLHTNPDLRLAMERQLATCSTCSHEAVCRGGSLADRMRLAGTPWEQEYCEARRWLIDHVHGVPA